jgi:hypothetical protein
MKARKGEKDNNGSHQIQPLKQILIGSRGLGEEIGEA